MITRFILNNKLFVTSLILIICIFIINEQKGIEVCNKIIEISYNTIPILLLMFLLLAFIKLGLNSNIVEKHIQRGNKYKNVLIAYLFGMFVSGPIYPGYSLGSMLISKGIKIRVIVILLSVWSTLKIPLLPYEVSILGLKLTIVRWFVTFILIYVLSIMMEKTIIFLNKIHNNGK